MPPSADDTDPTRELRPLIEQLHRTAIEAGNQRAKVERDRENIAGQLEDALAELHTARERETLLRSRFIEITSVIKERDGAVAAGERYIKTIAEMQRRLDTVTRETEQATRRSEESARQADAVTRSAQVAVAQLADAQKQVIAIRQARDAAQALGYQLKDKLARAEDELAELAAFRDAAQRPPAESEEEVAELRRKLEQAARERAELSKQVEELTLAIDAERRKTLELAADKSAVSLSDSDNSAALDAAREQLVSITQERDAARARAVAQTEELAQLAEEIQSLREAQAGARSPTVELEEIRRQSAAIAADRDLHLQREQELTRESASQQERLASLTEQLVAAQRGREEALKSVSAAQKQIEHIIRDRDAAREQQTESMMAMEAQLATLRDRCTELEQAADESNSKAAFDQGKQNDLRAMAQRYEQQRLESIELGARLVQAQREAIELTAALAESRLFLRANSAKAAAAAQTSLEPPPLPLSSGPRAGEVIGIQEPLTENDARSALTAMRYCIQAFGRQPSDLSLLNELYSHAIGFSERARVSAMVPLHRLSSAFAELTHALYTSPEQVNTSTMRTVQQTIEFLITLWKDKNLAKLTDPARARIYAVDDDVDNCQALAMSLELAMLRTTCVHDSAVALHELTTSPYDLIFLDVNLPGVDGFELCAQLRKIPLHAQTPIVFVTGLATLENRSQSSISGGNDFIGKPYNLHELSVKALMLLLKSQLGTT